MKRAGVVALVAICFQSACALAIQGPPKDYDGRRSPACDRGKGGVFGDAVLATTTGAIGLAAVESNAAAGGAAIAIGGLLALSAIRGNTAANQCRQAHHKFDAYVASREAQYPVSRPVAIVPDAPRPAPPPPPPPKPQPPSVSDADDDAPPPASDTNNPWGDFWELAP